jgi:signal transduction histidine kinase/ActR/RegA family two-component response regulator
LTSSEETCGDLDERVLLLLSESRDAESMPRVLEKIGVASMMCATPEVLCAEIGKGAGAVLIEEEILSPRTRECLVRVLDSQPSWSELPIIVLLRRGAETQAARDALFLPGEVTMVERPVRVNTLAAFVISALRSRRRQYLVRDEIDERKRKEEEIARLHNALEERAAELEAANGELETFNYTVAHDLRTPLMVISGYIGMVKELCGNELNDGCQEYLQEAYGGTLKMSQLIDALLDFSGLARVEPKRESVNLSAQAQEIVEELRLAEPKRQITLRIADGVEATGDPSLLRMVLANLLGNAWKFTQMRDEAVIEFGVTETAGRKTYFVRDNGAGFEMADATTIFGSFQRLRGTAQFSGHGIGLATVARVIQRHGGRIWAEGEPGKGATFYFTLPTTAPEPQRTMTSRTSGLAPDQPLHVLLAEDEPAVRGLIERTLRRCGWEVYLAENGKQAVERWERGGIDVVLMDTRMPGMDGITATRLIREREGQKGRRSCIIALTAHASPEDREECLAAGMDGFLTKPMRIDELEAAIKNCLH